MEKSLIIYSSVDGHTKAICKKISENAINTSVDIRSIDDHEVNLNDYTKIIIGASIRYGKYRENLYKFIDSNLEILNSKDNAFFSVNVVARKPNKNTPNTNPYMIKFLKKTLWKPKILKVFAGKIDYPKYKFFDKYAIRFIMWMTKGPTDLSKSFEFTDWDMVKKFSKELEI